MSNLETIPVEELSFDVMGLHIAGRRWGNGTNRVLALHARFDNANSFIELASLLQDTSMVALDLPGHGFSQHKPFYAEYNSWSEMPILLEIINQLKWIDFHLIGHCRGATIAALLTAALPDTSVISLIMLEPLLCSIDSSTSALERFLNLSSVSAGENTLYPTLDELIDSRVRRGISKSVVMHLSERAVIQSERGYQWRTDGRLRKAAVFDLSSEQLLALYRKIRSPKVLALFAKDGSGENYQKRGLLNRQPNNWELRPGSHHSHLEKEAPSIAQRIHRHWESNSANKNFFLAGAGGL